MLINSKRFKAISNQRKIHIKTRIFVYNYSKKCTHVDGSYL